MFWIFLFSVMDVSITVPRHKSYFPFVLKNKQGFLSFRDVNHVSLSREKIYIKKGLIYPFYINPKISKFPSLKTFVKHYRLKSLLLCLQRFGALLLYQEYKLQGEPLYILK